MAKTIDFRLVTAAEDRHGTIIEAAGMDLRQYRRNPVVLFNHDYGKVIGRAPAIAAHGAEIVAPVEFDTANAFAADILRQVDAGYLSGASAGFIVHEQRANRITRSELVELSVVSVPSNPDALAIRSQGRRVQFIRAERIFGLDMVRRIARESVAAAMMNAPLSGGHYRRLTLEDLTQEQRAAVEAARSHAAHDLGLSWFEVVPYVPLTPAGVEDVHATTYGQCRFDDPSAVWVRVTSPRSMALTVLHEARHLWQGKAPDASKRYAADPLPQEIEANVYAVFGLARLLQFEHNRKVF